MVLQVGGFSIYDISKWCIIVQFTCTCFLCSILLLNVNLCIYNTFLPLACKTQVMEFVLKYTCITWMNRFLLYNLKVDV